MVIVLIMSIVEDTILDVIQVKYMSAKEAIRAPISDTSEKMLVMSSNRAV